MASYAVSQKGLIGRFLPKIYIQRVTLEAQNSPLQATLQLVAKEHFDFKRPKGIWSGEEGFLKNAYVKIIQSTNRLLTEKIINNQIDVWQNFNNISGAKEEIINLSNIIRFPSLNERKKNYSSFIDKNRKQVFDIPYSVTFQNTDTTVKTGENPQHLAYFTISYIQNDKYAEATKVGIKPLLRGELTSEVVFSNFRLKSQGVVFYNSADQIHPGSVHRMQNGSFMEGEAHGSHNQPDYLRQEIVSNSKIMDLRNLDLVSSAGNSITPSTLERNPAYFSDLYITKDRQGNARLMFVIDCKKVYIHNAKYGSLFENPNIADEVMSYMNIRTLRLLRRKIQTTSPGAMATGVGGNEDIRIIAESRDITPRNFQSNSYYENGLLVGNIKETKISSANGNYRIFTGTDFDVSLEEVGEYEYGLEVEFEDQSEQFLVDLQSEIATAYNNVQTYSNDAGLKENYNSTSNNFTQEFKTCSLQENEKTLNDALNSYAKGSSLFLSTVDLPATNQILRSLYNTSHPINGSVDGIGILMTQLLSLLGYMNTSLLEPSGFYSQSEEAHPSGTDATEPLQNVIYLSEIFSDPFELFETSTGALVGMDFIYTTDAISNLDGLVVITADQWRERVQQEIDKFLLNGTNGDIASNSQYLSMAYANVGLALLLPFESNTIDLDYQEIETTAYARLLLQQSEPDPKLISGRPSTQAAINPIPAKENINSQATVIMSSLGVSLVGPSRIGAEEKVIMASTVDAYETVEADGNIIPADSSASTNSTTQAGETTQADQGKVATTKSTDTQQAEEAAAQVVTAIISSASVQTAVDNRTAASTSTTAVPDAASTSTILTEQEEKILATETNVGGDAAAATGAGTSSQANLEQSYNPNSQNNALNNFTEEEQQTIPPQVDSLFKPDNIFSPGACEEEQEVVEQCGVGPNLIEGFSELPEFRVIFDNLQQVEVLTGYGQNSVKFPIWTPLTEEVFNNLKGDNLCRVMAYENSILLGEINDMQLPIYNEYFILRSTISTSAQNMQNNLNFSFTNSDIQPEYINTATSFYNKGHSNTLPRTNRLVQRAHIFAMSQNSGQPVTQSTTTTATSQPTAAVTVTTRTIVPTTRTRTASTTTSTRTGGSMTGGGSRY